MARRSVSALTALFVVAAAAVGIGFGGRALWSRVTHTSATGCVVGTYSLSLSQAEVASRMVAVVLSRDLPQRAAVLVLAAALQESKLRNVPSGQGDRDSVGVLQQRPSQGWGSVEQLTDVGYATGKFLDAMVKVNNWQNDSLATVIQEVQRSADGDAYAKHETQATVLADTYVGTTAAGITCSFDTPTVAATANTVVTQLNAELPVGARAASASTVTVTGAGWATTAWLISHANRFGIATISYHEQTWSRTKGWTKDTSASAATVRAVLAEV